MIRPLRRRHGWMAAALAMWVVLLALRALVLR
jgi:hypothetical protein